MASIIWTDEAKFWLREIDEYISSDSPEAALRTILAIHDKVDLLWTFPNTGYRFHDIADRHVRILVYSHYLIAYWIKDSGNIDILGVYHSALDIRRYLK